MAQTRKDIREAYNKKAYKQYNFRVRKDSDLCRWLEEYKDGGNAINELIVQRLEAHFKHLINIGVLD
jgi:hypothetical protein